MGQGALHGLIQPMLQPLLGLLILHGNAIHPFKLVNQGRAL
jgi:hypothetical protein